TDDSHPPRFLDWRTIMNPHDTPPFPPANETPTTPVMPMMELDPVDPPLESAIAAQPEVKVTRAKRNLKPTVADRAAGALWNWVLPIMFLMSLFVLILYAAPYLLYHWRIMDAHAEAEAIF